MILTEPAPAVDAEWVAGALHRHFGLPAVLRPLVSERDRNLYAECDDGRAVLVKLSNSSEDPAVVAMENAATRRVAEVAPSLPLPRVVAAPGNGATLVVVAATCCG